MIKHLVGKGRGLVATKSFKRGDIALFESAICATLNTQETSTHCSHCFRAMPESSSSSSSHNNTLHYCSHTCTENSTSLLDKCDVSVFDDVPTRRYPRLIAQLVSSSLSSSNFQSFWNDVLTLASPKIFSAHSVSDEYHKLKQCFAPVMPTETHNIIFQNLPLEWYARMEGILHVNAIGLNPLPVKSCSTDDPMLGYLATPDVGVGLFTKASMLNHACDPSLVMYRDPSLAGPGVLFVASRDIRKHEELTISYLAESKNMERHTRQEELMYKYGFNCDCRLCADTT